MTEELENRLLRLKKSYEKLPIQSESKQVIKQLSNMEIEKKKTIKKFKLPVPAVVFASFIFLATFSTIWVVKKSTSNPSLPNSQTNQVEMVDEIEPNLILWSQDMTERFESSINHYAEELGLTLEQTKTLQHVQSGYSTLKYTVDLVETKDFLYANMQPEHWEQMIFDSIRSPHEMLQKLAHGEKLSLAEEQAFLLEYGDKIKQLSTIYSELLNTNNLEASPELLKQQGFILSTNNKGEYFQYVYDDFKSVLSEKLSPSALSYVESLSMKPYFYAGDFLFSEQRMVDSLVKLEPLLTNEDYEQFNDYDLLQLYYQGGIYKLFTGTDTYKIMENNTYSATFISVLNRLIEQNSGVSNLANTILQEIQNNHHSETLENLTSDQIWMELMKKKYDDIDIEIK